MLELYQFRHSPFCLKVRMALQAKGLEYKKIEVEPGIGQIEVFKLSGQRQVPVLMKEGKVIHGSGQIIQYLDEINPEPKLIPDEMTLGSQALIYESWADTTLANLVKSCLLKAMTIDPDLRVALLPGQLSSPIKNMIKILPLEFAQNMTEFFSAGDEIRLKKHLYNINLLVKNKRWIIGDSISVADLAIAAQLSLIYFPESSGKEIAGRGYKGIYDNPDFEHLFRWRDNLETYLLK